MSGKVAWLKLSLALPLSWLLLGCHHDPTPPVGVARISYARLIQTGDSLCWAAASEVALRAFGMQVPQYVIAAKGGSTIPSGGTNMQLFAENAVTCMPNPSVPSCAPERLSQPTGDEVACSCNWTHNGGPVLGPFPGLPATMTPLPGYQPRLQKSPMSTPLDGQQILDELKRVPPDQGIPIIYSLRFTDIGMNAQGEQILVDSGFGHVRDIVGITLAADGNPTMVLIWDPDFYNLEVPKDVTLDMGEREISYDTYAATLDGKPVSNMSEIDQREVHEADYYHIQIQYDDGRFMPESEHNKPLSPPWTDNVVAGGPRPGPGATGLATAPTSPGPTSGLAAGLAASVLAVIPTASAQEPAAKVSRYAKVSFAEAIAQSAGPASQHLAWLQQRRKVRGMGDRGPLALGAAIPIVSAGLSQITQSDGGAGAANGGGSSGGGGGRNRGGDSAAALFANVTNVVLYPVLDQGRVVDSFMMMLWQGKWEEGGLSNPGVTAALNRKRASLAGGAASGAQPFYLFSVPQTRSFFLARGNDLNTTLWTVTQQSDLGFTFAANPYTPQTVLGNLRVRAELLDRQRINQSAARPAGGTTPLPPSINPGVPPPPVAPMQPKVN